VGHCLRLQRRGHTSCPSNPPSLNNSTIGDRICPAPRCTYPVIENTETLLDHIMEHHSTNAHSPTSETFIELVTDIPERALQASRHIHRTLFIEQLTSYLCMCVIMQLNVHLYICTHTHSHSWGQINKTWNFETWKHTHTCTRTCTHMHAKHPRVNTHTHTLCTHLHPHTPTHTRKHTCISIHAYATGVSHSA